MMTSEKDRKEERYNWGEVLRPNHMRLVFSSMASALDIEAKESVILGRLSSGSLVDVDLTPFHAVDFGVSRQHAMISPDGEGFMVKDLDSSNGTALNGLRLEPNKSYKLHDGDMLFLGRMALTIRFLHEGVRIRRRLPRSATGSSDEHKMSTRTLNNPEKKNTRMVEMRGLLSKIKGDDKPK
ncbi:MAG: FHA domain-containing protein [Anaerolineae bacterium]|nr:FHA domain-containing protein [Anaerolineae bacterium]